MEIDGKRKLWIVSRNSAGCCSLSTETPDYFTCATGWFVEVLGVKKSRTLDKRAKIMIVSVVLIQRWIKNQLVRW